MSRCFPFPPPGYEKKARADEENLLNKEKQKEKKHKKEKKDREKREGKEKKEKERSEEKQKEKKDRKEKHKDKKDKHKDKERKSVSVEKDTARPPEHGIPEKLGPSPEQSAQTSDAKFLLELGKRIGNNDERSAEKNLLVHKFTLTGQGNIEKPGKDKGEDQRKVNERQNGVVAANGFIQKFEGVHRRTVGLGGLVEKSVQKRMEQEENNKQNNGGNRGGEQKERDLGKKIAVGGLEEKSVEKRMEQEEYNKQNNGESKGGAQKERDPGKKIGVGVLVEKPIEKQTEQEEKKKQKNGESRAGKHKDRDPERKSKSKDKKRDKEKEKEERKKERKKEKKREKELKKEQLKQRESAKPAADGADMKTASDILKEKSGGEGNVGKRKELETNGFLHDTGVRPSKLLRPVSSTHQVVENGRTAETSKTAIRFVENVEGNKKISSSLSVPRNERILESSPRHDCTHPVVENGTTTEPCKTAIRFVEDVEGSKKISASPPVSRNGIILEPSPRSVSATYQIMVNGRKPEPPKTAIRIVAESGKGNKVTSSLSVAGNGMEPCAIPKVVVSSKEIVENGWKPEPGKAAVSVLSEAEGTSGKVLSSISVAGTGSKMEPPTPSLPDPENGRRLELCRSNDQSASCGNMLIINHKVGSKEVRVNGKEGQQPSISLKRPAPSSIQDQLAPGGNMLVINPALCTKEIKINGKEAVAQQPNVSLKRPSSSLKQVKEKVIKPKPPHPDSKFLDSIYSVPQVELSDFDDQEWLFGSSSDSQQAKRLKVGSSQVEGTTKQVWAEALRLESADIVALPYVIRY